MGSPTSDDDPTRRVGGPGGWGQQPQGGGYPPPQQQPAYPPPGQGGWPGQDSPTTRFPQGEERRAQTQQFPQPGGWPPQGAPQQGGWPPQAPGGQYPGPQGPYPQQGGWSPPGGPPGPGGPGGPGTRPPDKSRRGLVVALVAGLVILAGVAVALVFAFTRDDGRTVAAGSTPSTAASTPPSTPQSSTPETTTSEPPPPSDSPDRTDELLAVLPFDFTDCQKADPADDGDVAAVDCGPSETQPGPDAASFYLYDDTSTLDSVFSDDADRLGIGPIADGENCDTAQGSLVWNTAEGEEGGEVACTVTDDGLLIFWTDREFGIEGVVTAPGSTQEDLSALADWWRSNSDFQR